MAYRREKTCARAVKLEKKNFNSLRECLGLLADNEWETYHKYVRKGWKKWTKDMFNSKST